MSLNRGELNPLSVLGMRKLNFIPEHFARITTKNYDIKILDQWINYHLNSRYAIKKKYALESQNKYLTEVLEIGLEDPSEIAILILGCPHLHKL
jgi:hypothetical protein